MFELPVLADALLLMLLMATATWGLSLVLDDVSIVDSIWSLFFLAAALLFFGASGADNLRALIVLGLVAAWALRLSGYLTWRNWGEPEDHRYAAMREKHGAAFPLKSLPIIFWLQAALAWIIAMPLYPALTGPWPMGFLDYAGVALVVTGIAFETTADLQLARFKGKPENKGRVLDTGLWRYSRHPNYFGDFCVWWGLYLIAVSAGGWWTIFSPVLMSVLLMRVSGVTLLEKDIGERRPAYADYIRRTSAFFPRPPRSNGASRISGREATQR